MIKISVIMAVYNARLTVGRMIDCLLAQTLRDFELVIVDDGSTDGSDKICDDYASRDSRIRVIHQPNQGVSAARQAGLDASLGEYVIHADADDYTEPQMLEHLYRKAKSADADVVICDYFADSMDGTISIRKQEPPTIPSEALRALFSRLHGSCCNKLAKRSCFAKYNISFPVGLNYCEDLLIWVQMFQHSDIRIAYLPEAFYHYVDNQSSATRNGSITMLQNIRLFTQRMAEALPKGAKDIDEYIETLPIAPFQYAFQHRLVSDRETRSEYKRLRRVVWKDAQGLRGRAIYLLMELNMMDLAHKLVK